MSRFRINFPVAMMDELVVQAETIRIEQRKGVMPMGELLTPATLPSYEAFVMNLMKAMPTCEEEFHHATTGISGEAGELLDISKKVWVYNKPMTPEMQRHIIEEMGDLRFYYQALLNLFHLTDELVQAADITKLRKRYHEGTYSDAQAQARADKPEEQGISSAGSKGSATPAPRSFIGHAPTPQDELIGKVVAITSGVLHETIGKVLQISPLQGVTCELLEAYGPYRKGDEVLVSKHELTIVPQAI